MALLEIKDLHVSFYTDAGEVKAVNGISFDLERGKVLGIVGESGSGKSVTAYSVLQILENNGRIVSGSIRIDGQELVGAGEKVMKTIRGNKISIIFQDPMTSLNPTYTIGRQIMEAILLHTDRTKEQAYERAATDALAKEEKDSLAATTYVNIVAVREEDKDNEKLKALVDALKSDKVKEFIEEKYKGAVVVMD
jgi:ABC-type dipeptide/oligopeptide/nickel transport system ATPase component